MNKILVDTNVLIYSIDEDSKYFDSAQKIFSEELELYTTSKNLSEFLTVVTRFSQNSLSLKEALLVIEDFINTMTILYPTKETFLVFRDLLKKYQPVGLQIHDYEILSIGLANQIDTVATFNEKDFKKVKEAKLYVL
ncbi:MAG: type II toxin-antitoxin system VapC family toxin [Ignavibacteriota bacterium]|jgi:predicted nucleic acid-binding protein|nr:type II toxin-antitoxin system VapC family toxin [Ignavibacteriales bacterium]MBL1122839.1 PIN domain-containing protein [Ignavibacteriota bacterium]MCC7093217.1 type II toxin-antitoxin system VapC family toxin [Ignavibacteriaceae bacterium]MCE7857368.1 PIN domain-containing protein [Ignavibacteria bacterium CHB3]MEB2296878.1 type II toxin-antitoxin system VapC family toxin [Ignavibacteria bacterium]